MRWKEIIQESPMGKILPTGNVEGENVFAFDPSERAALNGQTVYHVTSSKSLEKIQRSGGLRPRADASGEREFAMDTIRVGRDWRTPKGIWVTRGGPDWEGDVVLSFTIQPSDELLMAYSKGGHLMLTKPVAWDRIQVSQSQ
jgi:hypothetical protein